MKYLSAILVAFPSRSISAWTISSAREDISRFWVIASIAVCDCAAVGISAAGPVGIPGDGTVELLRRRHTRRTPLNLES